MPLELGQWIAREVGRDLVLRSIAALIVRPRMTAEARHRETDERRALSRARMIHALLDQTRRFRRIGAVAVAHEQVGERREILGDVAARSLHLAAHRDAEPIVLDVEDHR